MKTTIILFECELHIFPRFLSRISVDSNDIAPEQANADLGKLNQCILQLNVQQKFVYFLKIVDFHSLNAYTKAKNSIKPSNFTKEFKKIAS